MDSRLSLTKLSISLMGKLRLREVTDLWALVSEGSPMLKENPSFLALSHSICYHIGLPLNSAVSDKINVCSKMLGGLSKGNG